MKNIQVGDPAPDFSASDPQGQPLGLADFIGKKALVLFFYPADESPVCTREACAFRDAYQDFVAAGAEVIGVSGDSAASHQKFAEHHRLPFRLISDKDGKLRKAFGVPKTLGLLPGRVSYLIDRQGTVRHLFNSQLNGEKHVTEALEVLRKLDGGA
ncbi:peroxiredoxin [Trichloromonas sp.]|uniref:peroxiredoxin n=1 Tax=Trichloromonas sp. TaxID=3069249 RepID=UPI003D817E39